MVATHAPVNGVVERLHVGSLVCVARIVSIVISKNVHHQCLLRLGYVFIIIEGFSRQLHFSPTLRILPSAHRILTPFHLIPFYFHERTRRSHRTIDSSRCSPTIPLAADYRGRPIACAHALRLSLSSLTLFNSALGSIHSLYSSTPHIIPPKCAPWPSGLPL